jgi:hypothetical protein
VSGGATTDGTRNGLCRCGATWRCAARGMRCCCGGVANVCCEMVDRNSTVDRSVCRPLPRWEQGGSARRNHGRTDRQHSARGFWSSWPWGGVGGEGDGEVGREDDRDTNNAYALSRVPSRPVPPPPPRGRPGQNLIAAARPHPPFPFLRHRPRLP